MPPSVAHILSASRLVALVKPVGGVRPIVIGEVVYRLVGRALCFQLCGSIGAQLLWQFEVGFRGGCEVIIYGTRALLVLDPSRGVPQVDIRNAFNSVDRSAFFEELRRAGGDLALALPFVRAFHG